MSDTPRDTPATNGTSKALHPHVIALFAEHAAPTYSSKRSAHDALGPASAEFAGILKQIVEYEALVERIEFAAHDHGMDGVLEHLHQTIGAVKREVQAAKQAHRELGKALTQFDRYLAQARADLEHTASVATGGATPP